MLSFDAKSPLWSIFTSGCWKRDSFEDAERDKLRQLMRLWWALFSVSFIVHTVCVRMNPGHASHTLWNLQFYMQIAKSSSSSSVLLHGELTHLSFSSAPAAQTTIVHGVASLHKDPEASLHSQSHHSTRSQKAATVLFCAAVLANCPHVLGRAEVGAACREMLNCLSRSIRSAVLLAVPTHMALFFIFWVYTVERRGERGRERRGMDEEKVTERRRRDRRTGWKREMAIGKKDREKRETEMENQSGKKWVIEGDREKRVERVWNARREFNLFFGSVVPSQKCVYQPLLCH